MEEIRRERNYESHMGRTSMVGHKCTMLDRNKMEMSGVNEVNSFDANEILLDTKLGGLLIKGESLHIEQLNLDKGIVEVDGKIDAIIYSNKSVTQTTAKSVWSRMFR